MCPVADYGILTLAQLSQESNDQCTHPALPSALAVATFKALEDSKVVSSTGVVNLEVTSAEIANAVQSAAALLTPDVGKVLTSRLPYIDAAVKRARYMNVYELMGDNIEVCTCVTYVMLRPRECL